MEIDGHLVLPRRPTGTYLQSCSKETLKTNLYKVDFNTKAPVTIYSLSVMPNIPHDSGKLTIVVDHVQAQLEKILGTHIVCGRTIFGCQNKAPTPQSKIMADMGHQKFELTIKAVRNVDLSKIYSQKWSEVSLPINFLNDIMKRLFMSMKFTSIGRSGRYFDPTSKKTLANSGVLLFNGYQTRFNITQSGLYLQVDSMVRIVQSKTVLQEINSIYSRNSHLTKQQKRQVVKQELIHKAIMANYGNSRIWNIRDILFDFDLSNTHVDENSNINFIEYYERNYGLTIKNKKQPVLKGVLNGCSKKKQEERVLIPEFFLMSGLPEDIDERKRRDMSEHTIIQPPEKLKRIQKLMQSFSKSQTISRDALSENLGVTFSPVTQKIQAIVLPPPFIQLGRQQSIERNKVASFQLFNKQIYKHDIPMNIVVFMPHDYDFAPIDKLFSSTCKGLGIRYSINVVKQNYGDAKKVQIDIQNFIQDRDGKFDNFDLNWFILTPNLKNFYKCIKKLSMKASNPKATQVTLTSTLAKKSFASILTKILIQISSKIGNVPWAPKIPSAVNPKTMLIGIDYCKDTVNKKANVVAYCSTLNADMSRFHSNYHYQPTTASFSSKIRQVISDCLTAYGKFNSFMPEQIIVMKNDISEGEKDHIVNAEIEEIKKQLQQMKGNRPNLIFVTANKNSKQKFFLQNRGVSNPCFGTLINNKIVSKNYDFYLISQHCNNGTVKPVHYKVLYSDSTMQEGVLQELIYVQSFNYMNWSGSVRVPSVLQYASKMSTFVSENINRSAETEHLNGLLYYI